MHAEVLVASAGIGACARPQPRTRTRLSRTAAGAYGHQPPLIQAAYPSLALPLHWRKIGPCISRLADDILAAGRHAEDKMMPENTAIRSAYRSSTEWNQEAGTVVLFTAKPDNR